MFKADTRAFEWTGEFQPLNSILSQTDQNRENCDVFGVL